MLHMRAGAVQRAVRLPATRAGRRADRVPRTSGGLLGGRPRLSPDLPRYPWSPRRASRGRAGTLDQATHP